MTLTLRDLYAQTKADLQKSDIDNASWEARFLIKYVFGFEESDFITNPDDVIDETNLDVFLGYKKDRMAGRPLTKILGSAEFWGLPFKVNEHVLDPRPDSEILIEAILKHFGNNPPDVFVDLGTGSGCLSIALLSEWPESQAIAVDVSVNALGIAEYNAEMNHVSDRISFIEGNWFDAFEKNKNNKNDHDTYDLILSNPPYISNREIPNLDVEVKNHDPILALDGGFDGLDAYKKILSTLKNYLNPHGRCFFEIGFDQSHLLGRIVKNYGFSMNRVYKDLGGLDRAVEISFGENTEN